MEISWDSVTAPVHVTGIIDADADIVWEMLRDFSALKHYAHDVTSSDIEEGRPADQIGSVRRIKMHNGGEAREKLVALSDAGRYLRTLLLPPEPMPLRNYSEQLRVIPISDSGQSVVELVGTFSVPLGCSEDMQGRLSSMYKAALVGMRNYIKEIGGS